jgi:tetratricopeptide (TPR) repeat protein
MGELEVTRPALKRLSPKFRIFLLVLTCIPNPARVMGLGAPLAGVQQPTQPAVSNGARSAPDSDLNLQTLFQRAQDAQSRGDYQSAAATYQHVLKLRPHSAEARTNLGVMYHLLGDYRQAVSQFELALREKPELFAPNLFLGLDLLKLLEPRRALGYLKRAQRLDPHDEPTALGLGQAYAALRQFQAANDWYSRASEIKPEDPEALYGLGITYLNLQRAAASELGTKGQNSFFPKVLLAELVEQQGRVADAINLRKKLLEMNTAWPGIRTVLGFDYIQQGQIASAKAEFQAELIQSPGFLLARLGLARISLEEGHLESYTQGLAKIWTIDRNFFRARIDTFLSGLAPDKSRKLEEQLRGNASAMLDGDLRNFLSGRLAQSGQDLADVPPLGLVGESARSDRMALLDKTNPFDLYQQGHYSSCTEKMKENQAHLDRNHLRLLAQCGYYSGDYRVSFVAAGRVLTLKPDDLEALYWRAASSSKLAFRALFDAGLADPGSYRVHLLLGEAYRAMNNDKLSEAEFRQALAISPGDAAAHLGLATLYWQAKGYDKAIPELRDTLAKRPNDPEASYLMGDILVARRHYSEAYPYARAGLAASGKTAYYAHALLGKIYASEGKMEKAIKELQLALPGDDDGSIHFQIYQAYRRVGDPQAAADALRDSEAIRQRLDLEIRAALERSE